MNGTSQSRCDRVSPSGSAFVTVDDVDARTAKVAGAGGGVIVEPVDIPAVGRMAIIQDPTGGVIGIIKYANPDA